ncbi:hypothetical protein F2Q70_00004578 [Brassica cretica]|uniref:Uncharacterized protein n=1 Tax=Brassica cretica TaxID=69181 RepID=A0A8S9IRT3_BRACR|nr:hypothetical protein F2Q70_00004578 [Brassica cretica]
MSSGSSKSSSGGGAHGSAQRNSGSGLVAEDVARDQIGSVHILNVVVDRVGLEVDPEVFKQQSEQAATTILFVVGPEQKVFPCVEHPDEMKARIGLHMLKWDSSSRPADLILKT